MKKIAVLGAGLVGSAIARDLAEEFQVTSVDINEENLASLGAFDGIIKERADLSREAEIRRVIADADLVIGAVPGFMGYDMLRTVIDAGKDIVDISFFDEERHDLFGLDGLARQRQVTALVDCGVAPGMSNIILGYHDSRMTVSKFTCYVGGLPQRRSWPYEYKAPFSPIDVIEEYTRPARIMEGGQVVIREALSEAELLEFPPVGTLEAFNTDGLRSLLQTMNIPDMKEKTLRYPGHIALMRVMRESGFFSQTPLDIDGVPVKPIDVVSRLLFEQWKLQPGEAEFTIMRVLVTGEAGGKPSYHRYDLYDVYDAVNGVSSMARTTGYTCTAAARLVLNGDFTRKGICPPEYLGAAPGCFDKMRALLAERGVVYVHDPAD